MNEKSISAQSQAHLYAGEEQVYHTMGMLFNPDRV